MKAALLDVFGDVIGEVFDAPEKGNSIEIAELIDSEGNVLRVKNYKISRSKTNMAKATYKQPVSKYKNVWTFHCVENDQVVY